MSHNSIFQLTLSTPIGQDMFKSKQRFQIRLDDFRNLVQERKGKSSEILAEDVVSFYNYCTQVLLNELSQSIQSSNGSSTWRHLITYKNILRSIESVGIEMSYGIQYYGLGTSQT